MERRIQINGVWYVKEELDCVPENDTIEKKEIDVFKFMIWFDGVAFEDDDYCWEATRTYSDVVNNVFYPEVEIKFTDKRTKPWKEEFWDHNEWIFGVYLNNPGSIVEANRAMGRTGVKNFQSFLGVLVEKGWLKKP